MDLSDQSHGGLHLEPLPRGRHRVELRDGGLPGASSSWTTAYPRELILAIHAAKGAYVCDEIRREEDPRYVERAIGHEVLGYVDPHEFAGKRVLDFGCGAGASTLVMGRLLPPCELVGVELEERLLRVARLRARYIVLSAVYEHLLPNERCRLLPVLWDQLRPGGVLFVNQTPHRYSPIEMHTTGLPLINYLPDPIVFRAARRFSRRIEGDASWKALLREGIRGATIVEILELLGEGAELMAPREGDMIDLWHGKLSSRHAAFKKGLWAALKALKTPALWLPGKEGKRADNGYALVCVAAIQP